MFTVETCDLVIVDLTDCTSGETDGSITTDTQLIINGVAGSSFALFDVCLPKLDNLTTATNLTIDFSATTTLGDTTDFDLTGFVNVTTLVINVTNSNLDVD